MTMPKEGPQPGQPEQERGLLERITEAVEIPEQIRGDKAGEVTYLHTIALQYSRLRAEETERLHSRSGRSGTRYSEELLVRVGDHVAILAEAYPSEGTVVWQQEDRRPEDVAKPTWSSITESEARGFIASENGNGAGTNNGDSK